MTLPSVHPSADIWPLMTDEQIDALAADLVEQGQVLPIVFVDGLLLDGRNRWLACERAGIEPWTSEIETDDPDALAWSLNEHRRHAPDGVRALAAAKRANLPVGRPGGIVSGETISLRDAADRFDVSRATVARAKVVLDHGDPLIIGAVESGDIAVSLAEKTVRRIEQTGEAITSVADIKRIMRDTWREDHPAVKSEQPPPRVERSHVGVDTFGVINAVVRHADKIPVEKVKLEIDKWTRLNVLDDLSPAISYLTELKAALTEGE